VCRLIAAQHQRVPVVPSTLSGDACERKLASSLVRRAFLEQQDRLAAGPEAVLIAPGHAGDRCPALLRDGSDVGIWQISGQQSSVLADGKRLSVDNSVGVTGRPEKLYKSVSYGCR
jgi:hypothetical protein